MTVFPTAFFKSKTIKINAMKNGCSSFFFLISLIFTGQVESRSVDSLQKTFPTAVG